MKKLLFFLVFYISLSISLQAKVIKDQLGREVELSDNVQRIVVLQHQSLNVLNQIDALSKVVGVLESWEKYLGHAYNKLAPNLKNLPMPGDLKAINYESLLKLKPDVVIVANYISKDIIAKLEELKIPVIGISFFKANKNEQSKLNPTFDDEVKAYNDGFYEAISLLGEIADRKNQADELIAYVKKSQQYLHDKLALIDEEKRVRIFMANPDLTTYGSGKYTGIFFKRSGAINVAEKDIKGYKQISSEKLLFYNPDMIFIQERFPQVVLELKNNKALKSLRAIKEDKLFIMPQYAKAWGYPTPEAMALGEEWLARKFYPSLFEGDEDFDSKVEKYYQTFYRTSFK